MDWAKTTVRRDEKHLTFEIWGALYQTIDCSCFSANYKVLLLLSASEPAYYSDPISSCDNLVDGEASPAPEIADGDRGTCSEEVSNIAQSRLRIRTPFSPRAPVTTVLRVFGENLQCPIPNGFWLSLVSTGIDTSRPLNGFSVCFLLTSSSEQCEYRCRCPTRDCTFIVLEMATGIQTTARICEITTWRVDLWIKAGT